jgi:hypothetical protein
MDNIPHPNTLTDAFKAKSADALTAFMVLASDYCDADKPEDFCQLMRALVVIQHFYGCTGTTALISRIAKLLAQGAESTVCMCSVDDQSMVLLLTGQHNTPAAIVAAVTKIQAVAADQGLKAKTTTVVNGAEPDPELN